MALKATLPNRALSLEHRRAMSQLMASIDAGAGTRADVPITPEVLKERMRQRGVPPDENLASRDILRKRYPEGQDEP
jgi:hypothetical protein